MDQYIDRSIDRYTQYMDWLIHEWVDTLIWWVDWCIDVLVYEVIIYQWIDQRMDESILTYMHWLR
jgi:hypothetical protein